MAAIAEAGGGERQHPPELAAAENADGPTGRNHDSGDSATAAV